MIEPGKYIYPSMILLLIGGFLIFLSWSALQAAGLGSKVADVDYYAKGLKYNTSQVEKRAAEILGWKLEARLNGRKLEILITDRQGIGVGRGVATLYLAIPGKAENIRLPLLEDAAGRYTVKLADSLKGSIQARLELERQGARINRPMLLNL